MFDSNIYTHISQEQKVDAINKLNKKFWVRQVVVPGIMDNEEYLYSLKEFLDKNINYIEKIEFLPYHKLGEEKFKKLNIPLKIFDILIFRQYFF